MAVEIPCRKLPLFVRHTGSALLAITLTAPFPARASTDLTSMSLEQLLDQKVVGASKYEQKQREVAAAVSIITRSEIKTFGWRTLAEALASLPGIYTTYDRQYTYLGTRGFGLPGDLDTRILVTINGNRTNNVVFDQAPVGRDFPLDMDMIERIEYIPGPGGAVYGQNAMFGVVNVVTRTGGGVDGTELAAEYQHPQAMSQGRASWGKRFDNGVDALISISGMHARGEDRFFDFGASGVSGVARSLDGENDHQLFASIARGAWSFDVEYGDHRKDDPTGAYLSDPLMPGQYQRDVYALTQLQYQDSYAGGTLQVLGRLFAGQEDYRNALVIGTPIATPATSIWNGLELRMLSTAVENHKLMLGMEAQDNVRYDQALQDFANPANDIFIPGSGYRVGIYGQDEWRLTDMLTTTLGLRVDRNNVTGTNASPRAALIWQANPTTTIKTLYGLGHRAPNAFERDNYDGFTQVANPALHGERVETLEFVVDHRQGDDLLLRSSVYRWLMRDLIELGIDPVSGLTQYQSGSSVKATGLELSADRVWGWGGRVRGSVSLQRVHYDEGAPTINSPERLGKLNLSMPLPVASLRLGYELRYDSQRRSLDGTDLGGYTVSNLDVTASSWITGLDVSLVARNVFDKHYAQPGSHTNWQNALDQDGRSLSVEVRYHF